MTTFESESQIVEWLTRNLRSEDPDIRETALDRLGSLSGDYTASIAERLADPDARVRAAAAVNLGAVRLPAAWPHLVQAARSEASDEVTQLIVLSLGGYQDSSILDLLLDLTTQHERDYRIRMQVVIQLWKYVQDVAFSKLSATVLSDEHALVRLHAADSMELLDELEPRDLARQRLWTRLAEDDDPAVAAIAQTALNRGSVAKKTDDITIPILRRLQQEEARERSLALHRLSMLGADSAMTYAPPLLDDSQPAVRIAACACLGAIRHDRAIPLLLTALRGAPEVGIRKAALLGLENYRTTQIGNVALELLETGGLPGDMLSILCRQLWKYPSPRTVQLLRGVLESSVSLPYRGYVEDTLSFLRHMVGE